MKKIDTRSAVRKKRDAREKKICDMFLKIMEENPGIAKWNAVQSVGKKFVITSMGVKYILQKNGLYDVESNKHSKTEDI